MKLPKNKTLDIINSEFSDLFGKDRKYPEGEFSIVIKKILKTIKDKKYLKYLNEKSNEEIEILFFELFEKYLDDRANSNKSSIEAINHFNQYKIYGYLKSITPKSKSNKYSELTKNTLEKLHFEMFGIVKLLYSISFLDYPFSGIPNSFWIYNLNKYNQIDWFLLNDCELDVDALNAEFNIILNEKFPSIFIVDITLDQLMKYDVVIKIVNNYKILQNSFGIIVASQVAEALEALKFLGSECTIESIIATAQKIVKENNNN